MRARIESQRLPKPDASRTPCRTAVLNSDLADGCAYQYLIGPAEHWHEYPLVVSLKAAVRSTCTSMQMEILALLHQLGSETSCRADYRSANDARRDFRGLASKAMAMLRV